MYSQFMMHGQRNIKLCYVMIGDCECLLRSWDWN